MTSLLLQRPGPQEAPGAPGAGSTPGGLVTFGGRTSEARVLFVLVLIRPHSAKLEHSDWSTPDETLLFVVCVFILRNLFSETGE